jgi:hypothetical protein
MSQILPSLAEKAGFLGCAYIALAFVATTVLAAESVTSVRVEHYAHPGGLFLCSSVGGAGEY